MIVFFIVLIISCFIISLLDKLCQFFWYKPYYKYGLPLFKKDVLADNQLIEFYKYMTDNTYIDNMNWKGKILYKRLDENTIAFRNKDFLKIFLCVIPLGDRIYGKIFINEKKGTISYYGYININIFWSIIFYLISMIIMFIKRT
jgi:hypothetical protein